MGGSGVSGILVGLLLLAAQPAVALPPEAAAAEAGAALFRAGRLAESVGKLEEALTLAGDADREIVRRNLAVALASLGQEELRAGRLDEARERLERAVGLAPDEAPYQFLLALLHFRRGEHYEARQRVDRALELAPGLVEARELSGDLYYQDGSLDRARAEWEAGLAAAGPRAHALRAKLDRLGHEADAAGAFGRDVSRHFSIEYDGPVPGAVARTALRLLEEAYDRLWREFGRPPQHDVPVILYSRELFDRITRSPGWVAGTYDGKIRVPVGGLATAEDAERLAPVLAHELTHAFVRANAPGRLPLWFEEGLAQHFQGVGHEPARRGARDGGGFRSLAEVDAALRGGARVSTAYAAAALAVAEMIRMDGFWLPRRTLEHLAAGRPFAEAFRDAAGMELGEFEGRWAELQR